MASSTTYGNASQEIAALFADYLEGSGERPAFILSQNELPDQAKQALERSFESFGYESPACTFAIVSAGEVSLDPAAAYMLIEGLDPLIVVSADSSATSILAEAYRENLLLYAPLADNSEARLLGRPALVFADFPALLATPESKQQAWSLLKTLA